MNRFNRYAALVAAFTAFAGHAQENTDHCALPGVLAASDATGDATFTLVPFPVPGTDVLDTFVAEIPNEKGEQKIYFTLTVDSAAPEFLPGNSYQVSFMLADGVDRFALFNPYPTPPEATLFSGGDLMFSLGHNEVNATTGGNEFTIDGPLDAESNANPDGTITLVVSERQLRQLQPGEIITNIAGTSQFNGVAVTSDLDASDVPGIYQLRGNAACPAKSAELKSSSLLAGAPTLAMLLMLLPVALLRRRFASIK